MTLEQKKEMIKSNIDLIQEKINQVLDGNHLGDISPILKRINSTGNLPSWFNTLHDEGRLPNLDGKTVGSVIEKLLVCVLEKYVFDSEVILNVNPARGVDIPELELGVKSPSTNYCTSEPYFSAYERLLGNEYDAIILLTNYQEAKTRTPFRLQILEIKYLNKTEIADLKLCSMAKSIRNLYDDELNLSKRSNVFEFAVVDDLKKQAESITNNKDLELNIQLVDDKELIIDTVKNEIDKTIDVYLCLSHDLLVNNLYGKSASNDEIQALKNKLLEPIILFTLFLGDNYDNIEDIDKKNEIILSFCNTFYITNSLN